MLTKKPHQPSSVFAAIALMVGTAVGAGIFGLPFVFAQSGYAIGVSYVIGLGAVLGLVNLAYGEVVLATAGTHQFPVYVEKYLGKRWKYLAIVSTFIGFYGALAAYLLEVSHLLANLLQPIIGGDRFWYLLAYAGIMAIALLIGLRAVSLFERILMIGMLLLIMLLIIGGWPYLQPANFNPTANWQNFFLPYGVVLFASASASAVPDMKNILSRQPQRLQLAIIVGSCVPVIVYLIFTLMVVGITGSATSESALVGLGEALGWPVLIFGSLFGVITMSTAFLMLGLVLKEIYLYDFHWPPLLGWLAVILPPLLLVINNWLSFIEILGISGALIGGIDGVVIMKMHRQVHARQDRPSAFTITQSRLVHYLTYLVFIGGIGYEFYVVVKHLF